MLVKITQAGSIFNSPAERELGSLCNVLSEFDWIFILINALNCPLALLVQRLLGKCAFLDKWQLSKA